MLGVSRQSLAIFWTRFLFSASHQEARNHIFMQTLERQDAMEEAPMSGVWRTTGLRGAWVVPAPCVHQRPPRPVQTGGGRSVTPSSTQLVSLGRLLIFGWPGSPLFGDRQSAALPDLSSCVSKYLGKTASKCRLEVLPADVDFGETCRPRRIRPPLVP